MMPNAADLPVFHVVGFTGHRHLADPERTLKTIREVLAGIRSSGAAHWVGLSSIAAGSDLLFAKAALAAGMGWEAILPFSPAEFRQDFAPDEWNEVEAALAEAEAVRIIGTRHDREDAYLDCGIETVKHSDVLLALWDGAPARGRGGTAEIIAYARKIGHPLVIIHATTLAVTRENLERLQVGDRHLAAMNRLAAESEVSVTLAPFGMDTGLQAVRAFHKKVDDMATRHAPHFRRLTSTTVWLHVLATGLAAAGLSFGLHSAALPWGKLSCLVGALGVALVLKRKRDEHDWVRCRLAAEVTRSALATWGLPRSLRLLDDMDWAGLEPLRRSLDILQRRAARRTPADLTAFKQHYLAERVDSQLGYFDRHERRAGPLLRRLRVGFFVANALAIACTALYAAYSVIEFPVPDWFREWIFDLGPILLPVLAAAFVSLVAVNDLHRRHARYQEMRARLAAIRRDIEFARTWGSLELIVAKCERTLLQEVFEWHSITSFSEGH
jgi:hypothetical protein